MPTPQRFRVKDDEGITVAVTTNADEAQRVAKMLGDATIQQWVQSFRHENSYEWLVTDTYYNGIRSDF